MEPSIKRAMSFAAAVILSLTILLATAPAFAAEAATDLPVASAATIEAAITPAATETALNGFRFISLVGGVMGFAIVGAFVISGVRYLEDRDDSGE